MALITAQTVVKAGKKITWQPAANGDTATVGANTELWVRTAGTASTVTLTAQAAAGGTQPNGNALTNTVLALSANEFGVFPIDLNMYRNGNGQVEIAYSALTNVETAVVVR